MIADIKKLDLLRQLIYPSLLLFLIPLFSLWFFNHAENQVQNQVIQSLRNSAPRPGNKDEIEKIIAYFEAIPLARGFASNDPEIQKNFSQLPQELSTTFFFFRWGWRLALLSLVSGVLLYLLAGITAPLALRSQKAQYWSLSVGWHLIRSFLTLQVVVQACLVVLLSYWVTALFFNVYILKLILGVAVLAGCAVFAVLSSLLRRIENQFEVKGTLITPEQGPELWERLRILADKVGTAPPDQIIGGIDDNFFVTENPVRLNNKIYKGRTLFVSLSLLKTLSEDEANAILAHELAHFSGNDTLYSKKIAPLLNRYHHFLEALYQNLLTRPLFYCAATFRSLYELSLGKISREREFRADRIAADLVSPEAFTRAMVRTTSYSRYRQTVENELINAAQHHEEVKIRERIEQGFYAFAPTSLKQPDLIHQATVHPFDTHPPIDQRLAALGQSVDVERLKPFLEKSGDGAWFHSIRDAETVENNLWKDYEQLFQVFHDEFLAQQYLPANDAERAHVETFYPALSFPLRGEQILILDFEKMQINDGKEPVHFAQLETFKEAQDYLGRTILQLITKKDGDKKSQTITILLAKSEEDRLKFFEALQKYWYRHHFAQEFQRRKDQPENGEP